MNAKVERRVILPSVPTEKANLLLNTINSISIRNAKLREAQVKVLAANNSQLQVRGVIDAELRIGNQTFVTEAVVVEVVSSPLLGSEFLKDHKAKIDMQNDVMWLEHTNGIVQVDLTAKGASPEEDNYLAVAAIALGALEDLEVEAEGEGVASAMDPRAEELLKRFDISEGLGRTKLIEHKLELVPGTLPIMSRNYPIPVHYEAKVEELIKQLIKDDVIEESTSSWASPLFPIPKKDGSIRLVIDYRNLNLKTKKDALLTPGADELISSLHGLKVFSKMDFRSGYYQVPMEPESKHLTAFRFKGKLFQYKVMPFGLHSAPQTFTRLMNEVWKGCPWAKAYLDDVIVGSSSEEEHVKHLEEAFRRISEAGLKLNLGKCEFFREKVEFLGHVISRNEIMPAPDKLEAIRVAKAPKDKAELRSFLGMCEFHRKHIKDFSVIAIPLFQLLKKNVRFDFGPAQLLAFEKLKNALASPPVIALPDPSLPFIVRTDASKEAIGAVLIQKGEEGERVIEYFSKAFSPVQKRYATIEQEATAIVMTLRKWRRYLLGRKFLLQTDHKPLIWIKTMRNNNGKLGRMALELQEFDFEIEHVPGKMNSEADFLSRSAMMVDMKAIGEELDKDDQLKEAIGRNPQAFRAEGEMLFFIEEGGKRLCLPKSQQEYVLKTAHTEGVHMGEKKMLAEIRSKFYWKGLAGDVKRFVQNCPVCKSNKTNHQSPKKVPLMAIDIDLLTPWQRIATDVIGPLSESNGFKYILNLVDYRTKWRESVAVKDVQAETLIKEFDKIFKRWGPPQVLVSDRASYFECKKFTEFLESWKIEQHLTTAYQHQSNGLVERNNRSIWDQLRVLDGEWADNLDTCNGAYNGSWSRPIEMTPFEAMCGRPKPTTLTREFGLEAGPTKEQGSSREYLERMSRDYDEKNNTTPREVKAGDLVLVEMPTIVPGMARKLTCPTQGPFKVVEQKSETTVILEDVDGTQFQAHINQCRPASGGQVGRRRRRGRPKGGVGVIN